MNKIDEITEKYKREIRLNCNEYHQHSFRKSCFYSSDEKILDIFYLIEEIGRLNYKFDKIRDIIEE